MFGIGVLRVVFPVMSVVNCQTCVYVSQFLGFEKYFSGMVLKEAGKI